MSFSKGVKEVDVSNQYAKCYRSAGTNYFALLMQLNICTKKFKI